MRIHYTLVGLGLAAGAAHAQTTRLEREIFAARDTVWRAWFRNDTALLRRFIPPAAATLEGPGREAKWNTRADIIAGARGFADSKSRFVDVRFANTQVLPSGHTALVKSNYAIIVETN